MHRGSLLLVGCLACLFAAEAAPQVPVSPALKPMGDSPVHTAGFFDWLFGGGERYERRGREERPPRTEDRERRPPPRDDDDERPRMSPAPTGAYRTVCVRLCDGFWFPISYATTKARFAEDAAKCERQCPARSRLFVYQNPGQTPEQMVDA